MLPGYVVVIILCITLLLGCETALMSGRDHHIVVCLMTRARESSLCAKRRRNKTLILREQKDARRGGRLFGSLGPY